MDKRAEQVPAYRDAGDESWGVVGQRLNMHNSFWGLAGAELMVDGSEFSQCMVVGYIGHHKFEVGASSACTYVIECDGHHYLARHSAVAGALADPAVKRRVRKSGRPRLLSDAARPL